MDCKKLVTKENISSLGFYENGLWDNWVYSGDGVYGKLNFCENGGIYLDIEGKKGIITHSTGNLTVMDLYKLINYIKG